MRRLLVLGCALILALDALSGQAQTITLAGPGHQIGIAVGASGASQSTITFNLSSPPPAIGTKVQGVVNPGAGASIPIEIAYFRRFGGLSYNATITLTAQPTAAYPNGLTSGANVVPWTEFSWTVAGTAKSGSTTVGISPSDGSFPASFPTPTLMSLTCAANRFCYVQADYTFFYNNSAVYAAGTYSGTMTYTVTAN